MDISAEENEAIKQLRSELGEDADKMDDRALYKWLKARSFDVQKATTMFFNSKEVKRKMRVDKIREEFTPPEVIKKYLAGGICGHDKEGSPVSYELFGDLDMRGLMASAKKSDFERTKLWQCENFLLLFKEQSAKWNKDIDTLTVIIDMANSGTKNLWRPGLEMYTHLVALLEDNYPEMVKRLFVINAPSIFPILWKIGRPLISEDMKNKISILAGDYHSHLLAVIHADQLPVCYGGTMTDLDGNPRCAEKICQGGKVPLEYYLSENQDVAYLEEVWIQPSRFLYVECDVKVPGSLLRWEFQTEDKDMGFGIRFKSPEAGKKDEEVVPIKRFNCQHVVEDGHFVCEKPGQYVVVFDNSYSWTRWKHLYYMVELLHTEEEDENEMAALVRNEPTRTRLTARQQSTHL